MPKRRLALAGTLLFLFVAPGTVAGVVPYALSRWRIGPAFLGLGWTRLFGGLILALGTACLVECFLRFALKGRGTPAPIAPTEILVATGLYRYVRNPMYVAVLASILGQGLLLGSRALLGYALFVFVAFHLFVVFYEEPTLTRQFGSSYSAYKSHVRRWWPRLRPWRQESKYGEEGPKEAS